MRELDYVFVMTYGRSGSTLLMGILNSIPGWLLRGENRIDRLTEGLARVATAPPPPSAWTDASGRPRLFVQPQSFGTLLRAGFDPIRIFAGTNPAIYARLLDSVSELALVAIRGSDRGELYHQAEVIRRAAGAGLTDADDRDFVESRYDLFSRQFREGASEKRR